MVRNMPLSLQPYKGARDFYPEDKRLQNYIFTTMRRAVERYGYQEYDAPILEPTELYASKTSEEIVNEQTYTFTDRGKRSVTIRTEMTPSVSRMVAAKRQELAYPVRWYSIPNLWRYERPQRGRLREFWQLNVDIFGVQGITAEHETIAVAHDIMRGFGATESMYEIKLNSRQFIQDVLAGSLGLDETQVTTVIRLIDRMHKMDYAEFCGLLDGLMSPSQREAGATDLLLEFLQTSSLDDIPERIIQPSSTQALRELLALLSTSGITNAVFDPTLMRGFDYYTDVVFEVFDKHPDNNRAMFGGGRYDGLVGLFGVEPVPTVGFGMGDVTIQNFLETHALMPDLRSTVDVVVVLVGDVYQKALKVLTDLRGMGVNVAADTSGRKPDKQLKAAIKSGAPYVMFIGEQELDSGRFKIKEVASQAEEEHSLERIVSIVKRGAPEDLDSE